MCVYFMRANQEAARGVNPILAEAVDDVVRCKKIGNELDHGPQIPVISEFIEAEITRLSALKAPPVRSVSVEPLDRSFRDSLVDVYGKRIRQT